MATAKKLPSGAWRTLVYSHTVNVDGKDKNIYESFTAETKSESEFLAAEFKMTKTKKEKKKTKALVLKMTVGETLDKYIEMKALLSPTTIPRYKAIRKYAFQDIMDMPAKDMDDDIMQTAINKESKRKKLGKHKDEILSPKTVIDEYMLVSSALKKYHNKTFDVTLPKKIVKNVELPDPDRIIRLIKDSNVELPCILDIWLSFSMSEIRGIKCSDVKNGIIYINQVMVDVGREAVIKDQAKAEKRIRKHQLPTYIMSLIEKQGTYQDYIKNNNDQHLISFSGSQIYKRFKRIIEKEKIKMTFHDLRHLNASVMLFLGIPDKYAMERGGWKTPHTMKSVYQHTFSSQRKIVDQKIDDYFNKLL
jgi:integrase